MQYFVHLVQYFVYCYLYALIVCIICAIFSHNLCQNVYSKMVMFALFVVLPLFLKLVFIR